MSSPESSRSQPDSSSYLRKIRKPLIERKRRERINRCLVELKELLLENIKRSGGTQVSKLDKADILEMAVSHLRQIHHQHISVAMATSVSAVQQFQQGYSECINETMRFMEVSRQYPGNMISRVRSHLVNQLPGHPPTSFSPFIHSAHSSSSTARNPESSELHTEISDLFREKSFGHPKSLRTDTIYSERKCKSVSPVRRRKDNMETHTPTRKRSFDDMYSNKQFTPIKRERRELCFDSIFHTTGSQRSQNAVLTIPIRLPVNININDSPPQRQVWRPF